MKKYIFLTAAAVFSLWACQNELEIVTISDPAKVVAPVLHELPEAVAITSDNMSEKLSFEWEKADFGQPVQASYTVYGSTDEGETLVALFSNITSTSVKETTVKMETQYEAFNQLVTTDAKKGGLGLSAGIPTNVSFIIGATVGSNYQVFYSNARTVSITATAAERVYEMVWLPGSANGWNHAKAQHLFCYAEDKNTFVGVTDFGEDHASNMFKLTGAADWKDATGNWGMADATAPAESASITLLNGSNDNITIYTAHRYYNFTFTKDNLGLKMNAGFDKVGIIGLNGDWDNDIVMTLSAKQRFYADIDVAADTEFKFRLDGAWSTNWGGEMEALTGGGANLPVSAGKYRVYLDLNDWEAPTARLDASKYGTEEDAEEPEPEPEPEEVTGWNIIGLNGDWDHDILAAEKDGVWTAYITATDATEFKWRKDAGWDENYGGSFVAFGQAFDAVAGGDNIPIAAAGFYKVVLDLSNADAPTITIFDKFTVWSLIGVNGNWDKDIDMSEIDGKWVSPATSIDGEFKIRKNHGWDDNRGGTFASVGVAFAAEAGGSNINVPKGDYVVTYNPADETIVVDGAMPENLWSLIGVAGDWSNDIYMTKLSSGIWVSPVVTFSGEFKIRFNNGWDVNRGGDFSAAGARFAVTPGGPNINVPEGTWQIVYDPGLETVKVNACKNAWSVIGEFEGTSWNYDLYLSDMGGGIWESENFKADGGFKIRFDGGWDVNRGGAFANLGEAFEVTPGGENISLGDLAGNLFKLIYDANEEKITIKRTWCLVGNVNGTSWGDDFALTETAGGVWEGSAVINGEFKLRQSGTWDVNRGGTLAELGTAFAAEAGGPNISVPQNDKTYKVVYKEADETITVSE